MLCYALGLTDGIQCELMRKHGKKMRKPTGADEASGEHTTPNGIEYGKYWICKAAMLYYAHRGDGTVSYEATVEAQEQCGSFMHWPV